MCVYVCACVLALINHKIDIYHSKLLARVVGRRGISQGHRAMCVF